MFLKCKHIEITPTGFTGSWKEIDKIRAIILGLEGAAPSRYLISDEFSSDGDKISYSWLERKGHRSLDREARVLLEQKIIADLGACVARRAEAGDDNRPIAALPTDAKFLQLNKALHEARLEQVALVTETVQGREVEVASEVPRHLLLIDPPEQPEPISVDALVSGSNVIGAPTQLPLFDDVLVDVVYFLRHERFDEIRARVPLSLAQVINLATHIRASCLRNRPEDRHLTAITNPELYTLASTTV